MFGPRDLIQFRRIFADISLNMEDFTIEPLEANADQTLTPAPAPANTDGGYFDSPTSLSPETLPQELDIDDTKKLSKPIIRCKPNQHSLLFNQFEMKI